jgi:hypothetical protein
VGLRTWWATRDLKNVQPVTSTTDLEFVRQQLDLTLKGRYGKWLLVFLAAQLVVADGLMILYSWLGYKWKVPATVMQVWLGATVVQLVGIVYVVVSHLFPKAPGITASIPLATPPVPTIPTT